MLETARLTETRKKTRRLRLCRRRPCRAFRGRPARRARPHRAARAAARRDPRTARLSRAGRAAAGRGLRGGGAARRLAEIRRQVHPADADRRSGRHAGRRFLDAGALRAYARFDADRLEALAAAGETAPGTLLGKGMLALTIDQGEHTQRYQGIVALDGTSLRGGARGPISGSRSRSRPRSGSRWPSSCGPGRAAARALARRRPARAVPAGGAGAPAHAGSAGRRRRPRRSAAIEIDNAWLEGQALIGTIEPTELIDPTIEPERLLYRLFHEHGVRVFPGVRVADECSCSRERIRGILEGFSAEEIAESTEDGKIRVSCEFCSKDYEFDPRSLRPVSDHLRGGDLVGAAPPRQLAWFRESPRGFESVSTGAAKTRQVSAGVDCKASVHRARLARQVQRERRDVDIEQLAALRCASCSARP